MLTEISYKKLKEYISIDSDSEYEDNVVYIYWLAMAVQFGSDAFFHSFKIYRKYKAFVSLFQHDADNAVDENSLYYLAVLAPGNDKKLESLKEILILLHIWWYLVFFFRFFSLCFRVIVLGILLVTFVFLLGWFFTICVPILIKVFWLLLCFLLEVLSIILCNDNGFFGTMFEIDFAIFQLQIDLLEYSSSLTQNFKKFFTCHRELIDSLCNFIQDCVDNQNKKSKQAEEDWKLHKALLSNPEELKKWKILQLQQDGVLRVFHERTKDSFPREFNANFEGEVLFKAYRECTGPDFFISDSYAIDDISEDLHKCYTLTSTDRFKRAIQYVNDHSDDFRSFFNK